METQADASLFAANLDLPLQLSRCVSDVQRKHTSLLHSQCTVAEAINWLGISCGRTIPVVAAGCDRQTMASIRTLEAKTLLQILLEHMADHAFTLADFFAIRLSELSTDHPCIVYSDLDLVSAARRMHHDHKDLLLVCSGVDLSGWMTAGDLFDAMIGLAILDNALFNTQPNDPIHDDIVDAAQICCFQQPVSCIYDTTPAYALSCDNTILTALRILQNQPGACFLLSDRQGQCCQLMTAPMMLSALLNKFKQSALGSADDNIGAVLMHTLEGLLEPQSLLLTPDCSVLEALETIHFNNLSCAAIMSDPKRCDGIVTTETLLKAFFDSTDKAFTAMPC